MRAWVNGRLLTDPKSPSISVLDHGMIVGDGVFETMAINHDRPFARTRHLDRLVRSATGLGIGEPDLGAIRDGMAAVLDGQQIAFGRLRVTVTSGPGPLGSPRGDGGLTTTVIAEPCAKPGPTTSVVTVPWARNDQGALVGLKTISYAENAKMIEHARAHDATEAVMPNTRGRLCEGTGSNVFYVQDGTLVTPTLDSGCLAGITRALVLEWCAGELDVVERDAPIEVLRDADEVLLVGTTRDVQGVHRVDDHHVEAPGPLTRKAQEIWAREAAKTDDP